MKLRLSSIIVIMLAIIGLGVIAIAAAGLVKWFLDHFWVILITGAVLFGFLLWLKLSESDDHDGGAL